MPLIFWGVDLALAEQALPKAGLITGAILLLTGAVVGAIHGNF